MNHRKILKIWWLALVCGFIFSCMAKPLFAQDPAETRKWIGWGQAFGNYTQDDINQTEDSEGYTGEIMLSHRIFDDSMALGKAVMNTYFPVGFEDTFGNFHDVKLHVYHYYYSFGLGKSFEISNNFQIGATADLVGGLGMAIFKKHYRTASGQEINFDEKFGFDLLTGYQMTAFFDINNYWTVGFKTSVYRNRIYVEFGDINGQLDHIHSSMIFIGLKQGYVDCVPTAYVQCD